MKHRLFPFFYKSHKLRNSLLITYSRNFFFSYIFCIEIDRSKSWILLPIWRKKRFLIIFCPHISFFFVLIKIREEMIFLIVFTLGLERCCLLGGEGRGSYGRKTMNIIEEENFFSLLILLSFIFEFQLTKINENCNCCFL